MHEIISTHREQDVTDEHKVRKKAQHETDVMEAAVIRCLLVKLVQKISALILPSIPSSPRKLYKSEDNMPLPLSKHHGKRVCSVLKK